MALTILLGHEIRHRVTKHVGESLQPKVLGFHNQTVTSNFWRDNWIWEARLLVEVFWIAVDFLTLSLRVRYFKASLAAADLLFLIYMSRTVSLLQTHSADAFPYLYTRPNASLMVCSWTLQTHRTLGPWKSKESICNFPLLKPCWADTLSPFSLMKSGRNEVPQGFRKMRGGSAGPTYVHMKRPVMVHFWKISLVQTFTLKHFKTLISNRTGKKVIRLTWNCIITPSKVIVWSTYKLVFLQRRTVSFYENKPVLLFCFIFIFHLVKGSKEEL